MATTIALLLAEIKRLKETTFSHCPISAAVSSWTHLSPEVTETIQYERRDVNWRCGVRYSIRGSTPQFLLGEGEDVKKKMAYEKACVDMLKAIPEVQVEEHEPIQGEEKPTETTIAGTTIMMNDADNSTERQDQVISGLQQMLISSEPMVDFTDNAMTNRWYPMDQFLINASDTYTSEPMKTYNIPEFLYTAYPHNDAKGSATQINLLPLRGFIYGDLELEFKVMVTSAPFQQGRVMLSILPVPMGLVNRNRAIETLYEYDSTAGAEYRRSFKNVVASYTAFQVASARHNVIMDLADSTTGTVSTKFLFNRPVVRILDGETNPVNRGVRGAFVYSLLFHVITPLRVGPQQPNSVQVKIFYRFTKMRLTGITKQHPLTQMEFLPLIGEGLKIINGVERQLTRAGTRTANRDKPNDVFKFETVIPRPRLHFPNGKGIGDATIMAVDVTALTTHYEDNLEPQSWLDVAKIPTIVDRTTISTTQAVNSTVIELYASPIPTEHTTPFAGNTVYVNDHGYGCALDVVAGHFAYWSGTIVYRFDFVKTAFHRVTLQFSISYGKDEGAGDSVYEKIVEIQDRKSVEVTIPYIYDTIVRRTGTPGWHTFVPNPDTWGPDILPMYNNTKLTVRIVNPMLDISSVSPIIDVVVYKYAGEDFNLYCPVQSVDESWPETGVTGQWFRHFPWYKPPISDSDVGSTLEGFEYFPIRTSNVETQMEEPDFTAGPKAESRQNSDVVNVRFKDLLRRPILVGRKKLASNQYCYLPVAPPSRDLAFWFEDPTIAFSHQSHITRMFAMWRGDIEITIVVAGNPNGVVTVTYLPPDGIYRQMIQSRQNTRYFGSSQTPHVVGTVVDGVDYMSPAGSGCMTSIICPSVNPSEKFNIPYNSPYSYLYLNRSLGADALKTFRDISSLTNGTLAIETSSDCVLHIYYNVGDTFELQGFIGHPRILTTQTNAHADNYRMLKEKAVVDNPTLQITQAQELSRNNQVKAHDRARLLREEQHRIQEEARKGRDQASFRQSEPRSNTLFNYPETQIELENVIGTVTSVVPMVTAVASFFVPAELQPMLNTISLAMGSARISRSCIKFDNCANEVTNVGKNVNGLFAPTTQGETEVVTGLIEKAIGVTIPGVTEAIYSIASEILHCCTSKDWKGIALGIFNILRTLGLATRQLISSCISKVMGFFTSTTTVQAEFDIVAFFNMVLTLCCTAIYTTLFSKGPSAGYITEKTSKLMNMVQYFRGLSIIGGGVNFLTKFIGACVTFATGLIKDKDPQARILSEFAGKDEYVDSFVKEALFYLDERNSRFGFSVPNTKARFWFCTLNAYQISGMLYRAKNMVPAMRPLLDLCNKVIKKSDENIQSFERHIVKYVPYIVHICGPPRIGKSYLADKIVAIMAKNIDEKVNGMVPAYTFPVQAKWMNLYNGERFVKMDDYFALKDEECMLNEASFIMESKSPIPQNVPKPDIQSKKELFDLRGIVVASNNPYPDYRQVLNTVEACDQRFDQLWIARDNGREKDLTFSHLEFAQLPAQRPSGSAHPVNYAKLKYISAQHFFELIQEKHKQYHLQELRNVKARLTIQASTLEKASMVREYLVDPLTFFYEANETLVRNGELIEMTQSPSLLTVEDQLALLVNEFSQMKATKQVHGGWIISEADHTLLTDGVTEVQGFYEFSQKVITGVIKRCQKNVICTRCKFRMAKWAYEHKCERGCIYCPSCRTLSNTCGHLLELKCEVPKILRFLYWVWYYTGRISLGILEAALENPISTALFGISTIYKMTRVINTARLGRKMQAEFRTLPRMEYETPSWKWCYENAPLIRVATNLNGKMQHLQRNIAETRKFVQMVDDEELEHGEYYETVVKPAQRVRDRLMARDSVNLKSLYGETPATSLESVINPLVLPDPFSGYISEPPEDDEEKSVHGSPDFPLQYQFQRSDSISGTSYASSLPEDRPILEPHFPEAVSSLYDNPTAIETVCAFNLVTPTHDSINKYLASQPPKGLKRCMHAVLDTVCKDLKISREEMISNLVYCKVKDNAYYVFKVNAVDYVIPDGLCFEVSRLAGLMKCNRCLMADVGYASLFYETFYHKHLQVLRSAILQSMDQISFNVPKVYWNDALMQYDSGLALAVTTLTNKDWLLTMYQAVKDHYLLTIGGVVALYVVYSILNKTGIFAKIFSLITGTAMVPVAQGMVHHISNEQHMNRVRGARAKRAVLTQSQVEFYQNISVKVVKNYVTMLVGGRRLVGIGICDDCVLFPKHYHSVITEAQEVTVRFSPRATHEDTLFDTRNFKYIYTEQDDLMVVRLGRKAWFADIRKFLMLDKEYEDFGDDYAEFAYLNRDSSEVEFKPVNILNRLDQNIATDPRGYVYCSYRVIEYDFEEHGACGNVILRVGAVRPLMGIHISGIRNGKRGQGLIVSQEMVGRLLIGQYMRNFAPVEVEMDEATHDFGDTTNFEYIGSVSKKPYIAEKTALQHSLIAKEIAKEDTVQPAILSAKDERYTHEHSPLHYGVAKHGHPVNSFLQSDVEECREFWNELLVPRIKKNPQIKEVKIYDVKEAIVGLPHVVDYYEPLPSDTSVGYPFTVTGKTKKKEWIEYIRNEQEQAIDVKVHPEVQALIEKNSALRSKGILPAEIFQDELKDEKRPLHKLLSEGGTRVFSMSPVETSIAHRRYFMDFVNAMHYSLIDTWCAISINPDSMHWTQLANRLLSVSNHCFTIDFKNFGPGLEIEVASGFADLANKWYEYNGLTEGKIERKVLIDGLCNSLHIALGNIYRTRAGSPSGGTCTGEINSWTHLNYITLVWRIINRIKNKKINVIEKKKFQKVIDYLTLRNFSKLAWSLNDFLENVKGVVYGDDGIFTVSDIYKDVFNARVIGMVLACYGITATDSSKSAEITPYTPITEAIFLKRGFVFDRVKFRWMAPISETSIIECARWIREKKALKMATRENAGASMVLCFGRGKEYYDQWRKKVNDALLVHGIAPILWTWFDLEEMNFPTAQGFASAKFKDKILYNKCVNILRDI
nr:polyprotein [Iflaviridae sp.]